MYFIDALTNAEESLDIVRREAQRHGVLSPDTSTEHLRQIIDVCRQNVQVIMGYEPEPCTQPVHMIRPTDTTALAEAAGQTLDQDLGWNQTIESLTIHRVPGNHFSMMTGERARSVAAMVVECFDTHDSARVMG